MEEHLTETFAHRHIGPRENHAQRMLNTLGFSSLDELMDTAVPHNIRQGAPLNLPAPLSEPNALAELRRLARKNTVKKQLIGQGFYNTHMPAVIRRNVFENPGWYTAYTPYQPEISQGRLEALLNYQTMVADLTGFDLANASMLDEASAAAEAVLLMNRANRKNKDGKIVLDSNIFPQNIAVILGRTKALGIETEVADLRAGLPEGKITGVVLQQPGNDGGIGHHASIIAEAKEAGAMVTVIADLLALALITPPGEQGADIAVGNTQRFGVPLSFGGPHAAYMATSQKLVRSLPGRIVGVSTDDAGRPAYRLTLQTREQHIRREKATSNICTAQALLAVLVGFYGVYHGPEGLTAIAQRVHSHTARLAQALSSAGFELARDEFFDTLIISVDDADATMSAALEAGYNLRRFSDTQVGLSFDETTEASDVEAIAKLFDAKLDTAEANALPADLLRTSPFMTHEIFNSIRSESQMMRYTTRLANRDLTLDRTMIPLGSCTMKLNAAAEMEPITWPEFANIHPFVPEDQAAGWLELIAQLEGWLAEITGYAAVSVQPNAGSQGEYAGLLAIRHYLEAQGEHERKICLIPASAHGTNAASAKLAGLDIKVINSAPDGSIDVDHLDDLLAEHGEQVAAIMVTYPSTAGIYEAKIADVCGKVHDAGGQVYVDGANLNALVGIAQPGKFGGDVSHLNLHKTFAIPHGGGGPGVGPVCVAEHLVPFLPTEARHDDDGAAGTPVAATLYGSAGVLPITWAYIAMMGADGLTNATKNAVLSANYIAKRLGEHYPILFAGNNGLVAHECIVDLRPVTEKTGVTAEDVAKRLIDFGFHAPTMAFPVPGTLMVEPTESEDLAEIERFIEAMVTIREEIAEIEEGRVELESSVLRRSPHTAAAVVDTTWDRPYTVEQAAFPVASLRVDKYFPPVGRIDNAAGDRNIFCSCPPIEAFEN
ncbi:glycine dehydrogenase [Trueperella bonasi]|uniref:Glycine dehydrogenase (decarboxylating) n=1 Tax=Trueperella bonasi TaxID=312286 RepID=A0ABT9NEX9_9ACTO|nr:aminomethyl-transferring glycine dehydrogenase [Trueperella bonasi]MDP9805752.1 glycine dehydrogenase [Trueperella bonasi]